jgi:hypothetical protein
MWKTDDSRSVIVLTGQRAIPDIPSCAKNSAEGSSMKLIVLSRPVDLLPKTIVGVSALLSLTTSLGFAYQ